MNEGYAQIFKDAERTFVEIIIALQVCIARETELEPPVLRFLRSVFRRALYWICMHDNL